MVEEVHNCDLAPVELGPALVRVVDHNVPLHAEDVDEAALAQQILGLIRVGRVGLGGQAHALRCNVVLAREDEEDWLVGKCI